MACYYIVISSTHLSNGHLRNIKGVFRGPLNKNGSKNLDYAQRERTMAEALEDVKANFYCELCDKQYYKHQQFDNHINSYDHAHKQRLKELKQREFARNVASKSKKDGRKQERALQRLHELAEQRREVKCAPGSGPMFRSTTVAVEGGPRGVHGDRASSRAPICTGVRATCPSITLDTVTDNTSRIQAQQNMSSGVGKGDKKKMFSFSFPKKAYVKLESSAAVFWEDVEEGSNRQACKQRLSVLPVGPNSPMPPVGLNSSREKAQHNESGSHISDSKGQGLPHAPSRSDSSIPPADLCAILVYSENVPLPSAQTSVFHSHSNTLEDCGLDRVQGSLNVNSAEREEPEGQQRLGTETDKMILADVSHKGELPLSNCTDQINEAIYTQKVDKDLSDLEGEQLRSMPCKPYCSVLSKDGRTVLQWPSEMLTLTKTSPSISYSCNPLHFDFRASTKSVGCKVVERDQLKKSVELAMKTGIDDKTLEKCLLHRSLVSPECSFVQECCERPKGQDCLELRNELIRKDELCCNYTAQLASKSLTHTSLSVDTHRCFNRNHRRRLGHRGTTHQGRERHGGTTERLGNCLTLPNHCERLDEQIRANNVQQFQPDEPPQSLSVENNEGRIANNKDTAGVVSVRQAVAECANRPAVNLPHSDEALQGLGRIVQIKNKHHHISEHLNATEYTPLIFESLQTGLPFAITSPDLQNNRGPTPLHDQPLPESVLAQVGGRCRKRTMDDRIVVSTCVNPFFNKRSKRRKRRRRTYGDQNISVADMNCRKRNEQSGAADDLYQFNGSDFLGPEDRLDPGGLKSIDNGNGRSNCIGQINGSDLNRDVFCSGAKGSNVSLRSKPMMNPDQPSLHGPSESSCEMFCNAKMTETFNTTCTELEKNLFNTKDCYRSTLERQNVSLFQLLTDRAKKHCLQHFQAHRMAVHHQAFHGKSKLVRASPHVHASSSIALHPVNLPPPISTTFTIRQTVLQRHTDLIHSQHQLMTPILPFTHLPLGAKFCPPCPRPFIYSAPMSLMAQPGLHPMTMSFHPLTRMFSPVFPPQHNIIPLQPLF
uniref:C2H2-type domain-containing protein n=1 Tax=Esox lucius TaxID=8010 RepID=A0A3P8ZB55_ESOLU